VDARYDKGRIDSVIQSQALSSLWGSTGRAAARSWAFELANRESRSSWREFLIVLRPRGLHGVVASMTTTA
jgi:putative transposase